MSVVTASDARKRFGQLLRMAQTEPVHVQKDGRDVAVVMSADHYKMLVGASAPPRVRPVVEQLLAKSIEQHKAVYKALGKLG